MVRHPSKVPSGLPDRDAGAFAGEESYAISQQLSRYRSLCSPRCELWPSSGWPTIWTQSLLRMLPISPNRRMTRFTATPFFRRASSSSGLQIHTSSVLPLEAKTVRFLFTVSAALVTEAKWPFRWMEPR